MSSPHPTNPSLSAKERTVFIAGGSRGIGRFIALAFAKAGARAIVIVGRNASTLEDANEEISNTATASGHHTVTRHFVVDLCDADAVSGVFYAVRLEIGPVDVLVYNAGDVCVCSINDLSMEQYVGSFDVNVKGVLNTTKAFLRFGLDKEGTHRPTFINISTIGVAMPAFPSWSLYTASKIAAWTLVDHLHAEEQDKLRVFSVHPGRIATDLSKKLGIPTFDEPELPGALCTWLAATPAADFLQGRLIAANWDVDELLWRKDEIVGENLLKMSFPGIGYRESR